MLQVAIALLGTASAQDLCMSGSCPGTTTFNISGATPDGQVALLRGTGIGADVIPGGPCAGVTSGLSGLGVLKSKPWADGTGMAWLSNIFTGCPVTGFMQVLDLTTCSLSPATSVVPTNDCSPGVGALVGSFNINAGPLWSVGDTVAYNCLEGCAINFGGEPGNYQCSTSGGSVDNKSYVDGYGDSTYCSGAGVPEGFKIGGPTNCGGFGCYYSAWVADHGCTGPNYCWTR